MHLRTTAEVLARWLECQGGLWMVDGERALAGHLPLPAPADALAAALRAHGGPLAILAPEGCPIGEGAEIGGDEIAASAHDVDDSRVFQLAWLAFDGAPTDSWILAEHSALTESGERKLVPSSPAAMIETFRRELRSGTPRIAKKPG